MSPVRMDIDVTRIFPHRDTFLHHQFDSISFKFLTIVTALALYPISASSQVVQLFEVSIKSGGG